MGKVALPLSEFTYTQKLALLETLWDELAKDAGTFKSPSWHEDVLQDREKELQAGKIESSDWEKAKKRIKRNVSCG